MKHQESRATELRHQTLPDDECWSLSGRQRRRVGQYLGAVCLTLGLAACHQESDSKLLTTISAELEQPGQTDSPETNQDQVEPVEVKTEKPADSAELERPNQTDSPETNQDQVEPVEIKTEKPADIPIGAGGEELPEVESKLLLEIEALNRQLNLTAQGQQILDQLSLQIIGDEKEVKSLCGKERIACFRHNLLDNEPGEIILLRYEYYGLSLAHELLHAVYKQVFFATETDKIRSFNQLLVDTINEQYPKLSQQIRDYYNPQGLDNPFSRYDLLTEYYAYLATMASDLPLELETHYAEYFVDRRIIVDLETAWMKSLDEKRAARADWPEYHAIQVQEWQDCLATGQTEPDCQDYQPDEAAYQAYDDCLASSLSTVADCQQLSPNLVYFNNPPGIGAYSGELGSEQSS